MGAWPASKTGGAPNFELNAIRLDSSTQNHAVEVVGAWRDRRLLTLSATHANPSEYRAKGRLDLVMMR